MTKSCLYNETMVDTISAELINGHAYAKAIFICLPASHPFVEKEVYLNGKIKIGRTYMSAKQCRDKLFFDSKVLSKLHAVIWYDNGKFFLKDTKSSNGTFVNGNRLSAALEESEDHQIFSEDIVQFGVEVTETTDKDQPNVHSGVYTLLKLYHPDGTLATRPLESEQQKMPCPNITMRQLNILNDCLKLSMNRENVLKEKLGYLKNQLNNLEEITKKKWDFVIDEDLLLSKIETLQNRLESILSTNNQLKNVSDDAKMAILAKEIHTLHDQKELYQYEFKTIIKKTFDDKRAAEAKLQEAEMKLSASLREIKHLESLANKIKSELNTTDSTISFLDEELKTYKLETKKLLDEKQLYAKHILQLKENEQALNEEIKALKLQLKELELKTIELENNHQSKNTNSIMITNDLIKDDLEHISNNTQHNQLMNSQTLNNGIILTNDSKQFANCTDFFKCPVDEQSSQMFLEILYDYLNESKNFDDKMKTNRNEAILRHALSLLVVENKKLIKKLESHTEQNHFPNNCIANSTRNRTAKFTQALESNELILKSIQSVINNERSLINKENKISSLNQLVNELDDSFKCLKNEYNELRIKMLNRGRIEDEIVRNDVQNVLDSVIEKVEIQITQEEFDSKVSELTRLHNDYDKLRIENAKLRKENETIHEDKSALKEELEMVSYQNKMAHLIALVPLTVLLVSLILAYLPWISIATATKDI